MQKTTVTSGGCPMYIKRLPMVTSATAVPPPCRARPRYRDPHARGFLLVFRHHLQKSGCITYQYLLLQFSFGRRRAAGSRPVKDSA